MAITERAVETEAPAQPRGWRKITFGTGLIKGLGITMRHLLSRSVTVHYPDEQSPLPPRSRGVIALKEENCTVCMLCARECPDWCIYIDGHKETRQPAQEGRRARKYNVLDRFAIDYALCMYCGICVEVCPYDALFWTPEFEYAEHEIVNLTHEMEKLSDWMYTVLPPIPLDEGALGPEFKPAITPRAAPEPAAAGAVAAPKTVEGEPAVPTTEEKVTAPAEEVIATEVAAGEAAPQAQEPPPTAPVPTPTAGVSEEEAEEIGRKVYEDEIAKGSDPRVAEARRKAAVLRARKGTAGPGA